MSRFQLKITHHTKNQEDFKLKGKIQSIDVNTKIPELLELSDKDFKAAILKMLHKRLRTYLNKWKVKRKSQQRNKIYNKKNICVIRVLEGEEKEDEAEKIFKEIMTINFPNLAKNINQQIQEAERMPNMINPKKSIPRLYHSQTFENWRQREKSWKQQEKCNL